MKLYRCWIMWRHPLVMVIPCTLSLAFLGANLQKLTDFQTNFVSVIALTTLSLQIQETVDNLPTPDWYLSIVSGFFFISLGVNALVTVLIVYRIITVYNDIRGFKSNVQATTAQGNGQRNLYPLISILIESGLITFVAQLAQSVMYKYANDAFPLVGGCVVMLYVRVSCPSRLLICYFNVIYLLHREFRRQLSLCVSRQAFLTIIIHQGLRTQRIRGAQYSYGSSISKVGLI
jgi:hypothetical protein